MSSRGFLHRVPWCDVTRCLSDLGSILEQSHQRQACLYTTFVAINCLATDKSVPKGNKILSSILLVQWFKKDPLQPSYRSSRTCCSSDWILLMACVSLCSGISCMAQDCSLQMPEDFVLPLLPAEELKDKYRRYLFRDYVEVCVCVCVCVGSVCPAVSGMCSYGHWDSRGMWEGCEKAQRDLMCLFQWANPWISFTLRRPQAVFHFNIHGTS